MRKKKLLVIAGACLAALSLTVGSAMADPTNPAGPRDLAGTGSDTTQGVMNGLSDVVTKAGGTKIIASYDASGSTQITTKGTTGSAPCTMNRPSGSGAGIDALVASIAANNNCLQFARSSKNDSQADARAGKALTYIPFAIDQVGYATKISSSVPSTLSIQDLQNIYNCQTSFQPMLPQFSSGTRTVFLQALGFTDTSDFVTKANHTCILEKDATGAPLLENTGKKLFASNQIEPYSISVFLAQSNGVQADDHGFTKLGKINDVVPMQASPTATITREVFNVVPNSQLSSGTEINSAFVGGSSQVCTNTDVIKRFGFQTDPNCGSTTIQTR